MATTNTRAEDRTKEGPKKRNGQGYQRDRPSYLRIRNQTMSEIGATKKAKTGVGMITTRNKMQGNNLTTIRTQTLTTRNSIQERTRSLGVQKINMTASMVNTRLSITWEGKKIQRVTR